MSNDDQIILLHKRDISYNSIPHEESILQEWVMFVKKGENRAEIPLGVELESFLVFTLMRFTQRVDFFSFNLGVEYLNAISDQHVRRQGLSLSEIADMCLIHAGLFPERYKKIGIHPSYFRNIGCSALDSLASTFARRKQKGHASLYKTARDAFPFMAEVLLATREDTNYLERYSLLRV